MKPERDPNHWYAEPHMECGVQVGYKIWHGSGIGCVAQVFADLEPDPTGKRDAERIASVPEMEEEIERLRGIILKQGAEFSRHATAAHDLYENLYREVESRRGGPLPEGCSPLQAVQMMGQELDYARRDYRKASAERADLKEQLEAAITIIKRWQPESHMTREGIRAMVKIMADES